MGYGSVGTRERLLRFRAPTSLKYTIERSEGKLAAAGDLLQVGTPLVRSPLESWFDFRRLQPFLKVTWLFGLFPSKVNRIRKRRPRNPPRKKKTHTRARLRTSTLAQTQNKCSHRHRHRHTHTNTPGGGHKASRLCGACSLARDSESSPPCP